MTASVREALCELLDEYQGFDMTSLTSKFGMNKALRIRNARAALAADEKGEGELVKTLREIRVKVHAHNRGGDLHRWLREDVRDLCDAILAKHARAEGENISHHD